jgi:transaldolase
MKLFIDTADIEQIKEAAQMGAIDGVTTNPSLLAQVGKTNEQVIPEICEIVDGPISAEVFSTEADAIVAEGRKLARIHRNVVVKVPLIVEGLKAVRRLTAEAIRTNVTLCFSPNQALLAAKAGATYVSPFVGRLDDTSRDGMALIEQILTVYRHY